MAPVGARKGEQMTDALPYSQPHRVADLPAKKPLRFRLVPDAAQSAAIAAAIGASALRNVQFEGSLRPVGRRDVVLEAHLTGKAVQPCVVTLAPVTTAIDEEVVRRYLADMPEPEGEEVEMPEDDSAEPLPEVIDLGAVLTEALALALPLYPRATDAGEPGETEAGPPGAAPLTDATVRPFAGLAALRDRLKGDGGENEG